MTDVKLCEHTNRPVRRCECPEHLGGRAVIDGVTVVSPPVCGTRKGYLRHRSRKEPACDPCKAANAAHRHEHFQGTAERNREYNRARRRAALRLQQMYPRLWRALLMEELQRVHEPESERAGAG